jgi:hypothetical protein
MSDTFGVPAQNVNLSDVLTYLRLGLAGATALLSALKLKSDVPQEVIDAVQAAVDALQAVHGSDVVMSQLESLRLTPEW